MADRPRPYDATLLRRLRNDIPMELLIHHLGWPCKSRNGKCIFVCPECQESQSSINPKTNLARCFACQRNFNPIDFLMSVQRWDFAEIVEYLKPLLPR